MDFIVKLPASQGFDSILVFVCRRTKQAMFVPCNETIDSARTADLFLRNVFRFHGLPDEVISDRGPQFKAKFWKAIMKTLGIKINLSSAYHPESDGQTERVNQCLEQYLRCYIDYQQDNWVELLPYAEFSYNNSCHASTNLSPFYANYGFHPSVDHLQHQQSSNSPAVNAQLERIKEAQDYLQLSLEKANTNSQRHANQKRQDHHFKIGDNVWLLRNEISTLRPSQKLDHRKLGPFSIIEKINEVTFRLQLPDTMKIHNVFHVSRLEYHQQSTIPNREIPPPPPIHIQDMEEWEVENILDAKFFGKTLKFLVKWRGYPTNENTWEPEDHLVNSQLLVDEFKSKYPHRLIPKARGTRPGRRR
jgi:hypothetical protein